jgi:hypothetical protein
VSTHPETTVLRVLARAHRRLGSHARALATSSRTASSAASLPNLSAWVARLVDLEAALCERAAGLDPTARLVATRAELLRLHPAATNYHRQLVVCSLDELESELDRVFY